MSLLWDSHLHLFLFELSVFQLLIPMFSQRRQEGRFLLLLFPLASLIVASSSNAPPSFHRAARGSFRRRRSPERRAVGIPPLPIIIQCSPLFLFLSHVVDTLANKHAKHDLQRHKGKLLTIFNVFWESLFAYSGWVGRGGHVVFFRNARRLRR